MHPVSSGGKAAVVRSLLLKIDDGHTHLDIGACLHALGHWPSKLLLAGLRGRAQQWEAFEAKGRKKRPRLVQPCESGVPLPSRIEDVKNC